MVHEQCFFVLSTAFERNANGSVDDILRRIFDFNSRYTTTKDSLHCRECNTPVGVVKDGSARTLHDHMHNALQNCIDSNMVETYMVDKEKKELRYLFIEPESHIYQNYGISYIRYKKLYNLRLHEAISNVYDFMTYNRVIQLFMYHRYKSTGDHVVDIANNWGLLKQYLITYDIFSEVIFNSLTIHHISQVFDSSIYGIYPDEEPPIMRVYN